MKLRKILSAFLCALALSALLPLSAAADTDTDIPAAARITDSDHEIFDEKIDAADPIQNFASPKDAPVGSVPAEHTLSCASFITGTERSAYIDCMTERYIAHNSELKETLKAGEPVVMLFEGGSDNVETTVGTERRDGAVCLVIRQDDAQSDPYIAYYNTDCTTVPDYPFGYGYDNGHTGYGTATPIDGIYSIYTFNHRSTFAAFNVRVGEKAEVPAVYIKENGTFSNLNATGINIHARVSRSVSGDELAPRSAGCLLIDGGTPFDEYMRFIESAMPPSCQLIDSEFCGSPIKKYTADWNNIKAGMLVIDRFLAKDALLDIYKSKDIIEYITQNSTLAQSDAENIISSCECYPSYLNVNAAQGTKLRVLPVPGSEVSGTDCAEACTLTVTGLYKNGDNFFYRVLQSGATYYVDASDVTDAACLYDDVVIHNENYPVVKQLSKSFSLTGILSSLYNRYTGISAALYDSEGATDCAVNYDDSFHCYSIAWPSPVDNKMTFGKLTVGQHRYVLAGNVRNYYISDGTLSYEDKSVTLVDKTFRVAPLVTFEANGGTVDTASALVDENGKLASLPTPSYEGYLFDGWFTAETGGSKISADAVYTANTTIYAHWTRDALVVGRLSGESRVDTAIAISSKWESSECAVIAYGGNYPDALAAAPLAAALDCPILLTANPAAGLEETIVSEMERLGVSKVYIIGGGYVVSPAIENALKTVYGEDNVTRLFGMGRYETSIEIARELLSIRKSKGMGNFTNVYFCSDSGFADALSISPAAGIELNPILYAPSAGRSISQSSNAMYEFIKELSSSGMKDTAIIGGIYAVSPEAAADIESITGRAPVRVDAGETGGRFETMLAVCKKYDSLLRSNRTICVATGANFPDALAGASFAARNRCPIILVDGTETFHASDELREYIEAKGTRICYVFGGEYAVPDNCVNELFE